MTVNDLCSLNLGNFYFLMQYFFAATYIGRHHPVCLLVFGIQKELPRRKYFYSEKELAANFHLMWFISLFLLSLLIYPFIYLYLLVVRVLRYILSLTTENHLMNG